MLHFLSILVFFLLMGWFFPKVDGWKRAACVVFVVAVLFHKFLSF